MKVSIIIRAKNEERWISSCLKSVFSQTFDNFEVILVDNKSTDKTVEKAKRFDIKLVEIEHFFPGQAINVGIRHSTGDIIVCLSGHCIPVNEDWLANLVRNFNDPQIAGVYGRQEPMPFSTDLDKRDLMIVFGLDRKVQKKDPFFHNANSAICRNIWEDIPFDEEATNIEDRIWARQVLSQGYSLIYEPDASVYHHHGIHQELDKERAHNIVRILESLEEDNNKSVQTDARELEIVALIPVIGPVKYCEKKPILEYVVQQATKAKSVGRVIVSTDNQELVRIARNAGAEVPFLRPEKLSLEYVGLREVLRYSLEQIESRNILPDLLVIMGVTYPFRPEGLIDRLVSKLLKEGLDSVVPVKREYRTIWTEEDGEVKMIGDGFMPRQFKRSPFFISLMGLGYVTHPQFIRQGEFFGEKMGIMEITDVFAHLEIREDVYGQLYPFNYKRDADSA